MRPRFSAVIFGLAVAAFAVPTPGLSQRTPTGLRGDDAVASRRVGVVEVPETPADVAAENRAIEQALQKEVGSLRFENTPLERILDSMRGLLGVNMHIFWTALEDAGVPKDRPVTLRLDKTRAGRALQLVLADAGGGEVALAYEVRAGVLEIATREQLDKELIVRVYNIRDLLTAAEAWERKLAEFEARRAGASGQVTPTPSSEVRVATDAVPGERVWGRDREELLRMVLQDHVAPDSWRANGGSGSVSCFNGVLIVCQPPAVHRQVEDLLNALLRAGAAEKK